MSIAVNSIRSKILLYHSVVKRLDSFPNNKFWTLPEFAHDNFFDTNGRKFSKQVENTAGKGEIARYKQFLLFSQCFPNTCTVDM